MSRLPKALAISVLNQDTDGSDGMCCFGALVPFNPNYRGWLPDAAYEAANSNAPREDHDIPNRLPSQAEVSAMKIISADRGCAFRRFFREKI